jgi:hypothetical protein
MTRLAVALWLRVNDTMDWPRFALVSAGTAIGGTMTAIGAAMFLGGYSIVGAGVFAASFATCMVVCGTRVDRTSRLAIREAELDRQLAACDTNNARECGCAMCEQSLIFAQAGLR